MTTTVRLVRGKETWEASVSNGQIFTDELRVRVSILDEKCATLLLSIVTVSPTTLEDPRRVQTKLVTCDADLPQESHEIGRIKMGRGQRPVVVYVARS